jgi:adenine C2-methylase RlmN of 23S rRNA A2503 and tRNA A37
MIEISIENLDDNWRDRVIQLKGQEDFINHIITRQLAEFAKNYIDSADNVLLNDENISTEDRKALLKSRKVHQMYYELFTNDPTDELTQIKDKYEETNG